MWTHIKGHCFPSAPDRAAVCRGLDGELRADHLRRSLLRSAPPPPSLGCRDSGAEIRRHYRITLSATSSYFVLCIWPSGWIR